MGIARKFFSVGGNSQTLLAILFLVPVVPAMGQVHIRESVTIAPGESKKVRVGITHSLRYEFYWSGGDSAEVEYYNLDCSPDTTIWSQSSPIVVELEPAEAGVYVFKPWMKYNVSSPPPSIYVAFKLFFDNAMVDSGADGASYGLWFAATGIAKSGYPYGRGSPQAWPVLSTSYDYFALSLSPSPTWMPLYHGGSANINLFAGYDCSSSWTPWSAQDPLTLTIASGSQYASFYGWDAGSGSEVRLGPVVNTTGTNIQNYSTSPYLVADGIQPDSVAEWVVVQGESGGLTSTDSIPILLPPVAVTFAPPEIPPGDTADIILRERNPDGTTADFPPDQLFEVGISSGNSYGTILSSGDTAGYFASVPQGLKFIAADSIGADSAMVGVQVEPAMALPSSAAPGRKGSDNKAVVSKSKSVSQNVRSPSANVSAAMAANGRRKSVSFTDGQYSIGWVKIMEKQSYVLKILDHAPWTIWPDLPAGTITREETPIGYNPIRTFDIQVTDASGQPVKGASVEIIHNYQQGTGGHSHGASGDVIPGQPLQGIFYGQGGSGPSLELTTDENGMAFVNKYLASQISGTYLITAYLKSDSNVKDTVNLNVQIPGLVNFRWLIFKPNEGNEKPYTFAQTTQAAVQNHPDNDWCTMALGDSLFLGIWDFYEWSASPEGGGAPRIISLNDMSLPWGGLFDAVKADWKTPHNLHRIGRSVDINNDGIFQKPAPDNPKIPIMTKPGRKLQKYMNAHHGFRIIEGKSVHYEFYDAY